MKFIPVFCLHLGRKGTFVHVSCPSSSFRTASTPSVLVSLKQDQGRGFILLLPQTAVMPCLFDENGSARIATAPTLFYMCTYFSQKSICNVTSKLFLAVKLRFISKSSSCKSSERISLFRQKGFQVIFYSGSSVSLKSGK